MADTKPPHLPQLDGLRGVAIALVLVAHFPPSEGFAAVLPWGALGVQLFFVLSGFLITRILLRCRDAIAVGGATLRSSLRGFYGRRCLRIVPVFYLSLAVLWLCDAGRVRALREK